MSLKSLVSMNLIGKMIGSKEAEITGRVQYFDTKGVLIAIEDAACRLFLAFSNPISEASDWQILKQSVTRWAAVKTEISPYNRRMVSPFFTKIEDAERFGKDNFAYYEVISYTFEEAIGNES